MIAGTQATFVERDGVRLPVYEAGEGRRCSCQRVLWAELVRKRQPQLEDSARLEGAVVRQPAAMEGLREVVPDLRVFEVLEGCGHWTQQERPEEVTDLLLRFLSSLAA